MSNIINCVLDDGRKQNHVHDNPINHLQNHRNMGYTTDPQIEQYLISTFLIFTVLAFSSMTIQWDPVNGSPEYECFS